MFFAEFSLYNIHCALQHIGRLTHKPVFFQILQSKICSQRSRVTPSRNGLIVSTSNSSQSSAASKYLNIRYMTLKLFIVSLLFVCGGFLGPSPYQHIPLTFANTHLLTGGLHCDGAVFFYFLGYCRFWPTSGNFRRG